MTEDPLRKSEVPLEAQPGRTADEVRTASEQAAPAIAGVAKTRDMLKALEASGALGAIRADVGRFLQPNWPNAGAFGDLANHFEKIRDAQKAFAKYEAQFQLPEVKQAMLLAKQFSGSAFAKEFAWAKAYDDRIARAAGAMTAPWLKIADQLRSFGAFAEIQRIGTALREQATFAIPVTDRLRVDLGDWRTPITWPQKIFEDLPTRQAFYVERGFKQQLTDFPPAAFDEATAIAGLSAEDSQRVEAAITADQNDEEENLKLSNQAYARLRRFEARVRKFIETTLRDAIGENWMEVCVPEHTRRQWERKKRNAVSAREPEAPLLAYAAFSDYAGILTQTGNWAIFAAVFEREESVVESFQRLVPIRNATMHGRPIGQDDLLFLYVETMRVLKAIERAEGSV